MADTYTGDIVYEEFDYRRWRATIHKNGTWKEQQRTFTKVGAHIWLRYAAWRWRAAAKKAQRYRDRSETNIPL